MLTFWLWRRLRFPPQVMPLPWLKSRLKVKPRRSLLRALVPLTIAIGGVIWMLQSPIAFFAILWFLLAMPFGFLILNGTLYGLYWSTRISMTIGREHRRRSYEMMSLAPGGPLGASWLMTTMILNRSQTLRQLHIIVRAVVIIALITLVLAAGVIYASAQSNPATQNSSIAAFASMLLIALGMIALFFDHLQSVVVGSLLGMLIPTYISAPLDARLWTTVVFLFLQVGFYLTLLIFGSSSLPLIFDVIGWQGFGANVMQGFIWVLAGIALRESLIRLMWRDLLKRLNATSEDLRPAGA